MIKQSFKFPNENFQKIKNSKFTSIKSFFTRQLFSRKLYFITIRQNSDKFRWIDSSYPILFHFNIYKTKRQRDNSLFQELHFLLEQLFQFCNFSKTSIRFVVPRCTNNKTVKSLGVSGSQHRHLSFGRVDFRGHFCFFLSFLSFQAGRLVAGEKQHGPETSVRDPLSQQDFVRKLLSLGRRVNRAVARVHLFVTWPAWTWTSLTHLFSPKPPPPQPEDIRHPLLGPFHLSTNSSK